ncbi:E3 ubiquitin-protein ligase TRIM39 [Acipenser ruthenus]|uniref:E3 ubiquitin-protein ligase TRIM39 n=1 Tax=Acipenser ruthenus TaxID=7906 RepID=A0A444UTH7_ACIRT|nr:E3 ubiquitin-protein ligase TRIM39 [Acipenser ruthenus]
MRDGSKFWCGDELLPLRLAPQRVGMYLDDEEGEISFYNADTRAHIHTLTDTFTETLSILLYPSHRRR